MKLIEELKERGLVDALTDPAIAEALDRPVTLYCGFDPSAKSLQAGNLVSIMVLKRFQQAGHRVIAWWAALRASSATRAARAPSGTC